MNDLDAQVAEVKAFLRFVSKRKVRGETVIVRPAHVKTRTLDSKTIVMAVWHAGLAESIPLNEEQVGRVIAVLQSAGAFSA